MGGYRTGDGRWVKMGLLYRADQLNHLDGSELSSLRSLGLRRVIDLRQAVEREHEPDPTIPSVENLHFDVLADAGLDADAMPPGGWSLISSGGGADYMKTLYRSFVTLPSARKSYGGLLSSLIKDNGPVLFHCTAGQDRTGWGAAIILRALGVPREEIVKDYMMSVPLLSEKHGNLIKEYAAKLTDRNVSVEDLEPLFWIRSDYLDAAFDEVDRRYGSFDSYLRDGLGFDESEISALRSKYLK
jgi:protein-tyrosine phosphatase